MNALARIITAFALTAAAISIAAKPVEYTNPIIHADYSDPDAIRVGDDYWLTASSFVNTPGLPILHSTDLVNWELVNHAVKRVPPYDFYDAAPQHGKGIWAPSIRHHDGKFYIYWGDPDFGIFMTSATDPRGQWSEPVLVKAGKGMIDPVPLWDDNGRVYLAHAWAGSRIAFNSVVTVIELSVDGTRAISDPVMVFDGNDGINHTIEGPKLYKHNGHYYIFAPAGGVATGWQLVLKADNIYGPYEKRIVMAQGTTDINGPHQGAWVTTPDGGDWFLHFQDKGLYGRVLHLNPMQWLDDGFPVIGKAAAKGQPGEPVASHAMPVAGTKQSLPKTISDDFSVITLASQWEWAANYHDWFGFPTSQGFFRLNSAILPDANANLWSVPNLLVQKFPAEEFTVTAKVKASAKQPTTCARQGLVLFGYDYGYIGVEKRGDTFRLVQGECIDSDKGSAEQVADLGIDIPTTLYTAGLYPNLCADIWLRAKVAKGGIATWQYSLDGKKFHTVGTPFKARQGKWVGAKAGLFSTVTPGNERAWLDADQFDIEIKR